KICVETTGNEAQALQQTCNSAATTGSGVTATYAAAPCSHVGALGACRVTSGGITEDGWYYQETIGDAGYTGLTSATVQMLCAQEGATFLAP
ncbi:MAG TPA: hypothetical protein VKZ18_07150, partial [Polyangia bacterium]|nr:hypothetical protein [Polyangia bacterium]